MFAEEEISAKGALKYAANFSEALNDIESKAFKEMKDTMENVVHTHVRIKATKI